MQHNQNKENVLLYIAEHNGDIFDYDLVSSHFEIAEKEIFQCLSELREEKKIVAEQHYLRKPILLSNDDWKNFYWKVFIRSEKNPKSRLGSLP